MTYRQRASIAFQLHLPATATSSALPPSYTLTSPPAANRCPCLPPARSSPPPSRSAWWCAYTLALPWTTSCWPTDAGAVLCPSLVEGWAFLIISPSHSRIALIFTSLSFVIISNCTSGVSCDDADAQDSSFIPLRCLQPCPPCSHRHLILHPQALLTAPFITTIGLPPPPLEESSHSALPTTPLTRCDCHPFVIMATAGSRIQRQPHHADDAGNLAGQQQ